MNETRIDARHHPIHLSQVTYSVADGGEQQEVVVEEGATLELQGEPKPPGPIQVVDAKYGDLANPEA